MARKRKPVKAEDAAHAVRSGVIAATSARRAARAGGEARLPGHHRSCSCKVCRRMV
jgi:hypothetical protein